LAGSANAFTLSAASPRFGAEFVGLVAIQFDSIQLAPIQFDLLEVVFSHAMRRHHMRSTQLNVAATFTAPNARWETSIVAARNQ
jgi:hypothetical protein